MNTNILAHWVHDLDPFLIRFGEGFGIRYYGLAYVLGFLIAYGLLSFYHRRGRSPLNADQQSNAMLVLLLGVMIGGRLGYFLFYDSGALRDPLALIRVWEGGMASHGGFLGVAAAFFWIARREKISVFRLSDILVTVVPPGLFLGRVANFINGELYGKVTSVPWAVRFPLSTPEGTPPELIEPRHPSQLYEAGLEGLAIFIYLQIRFWKSSVTRVTPGQLAGEFLIAYAAARIFCEFFREPDADLILGMSRGIFYSIFLLAGGAAVIVIARRRASRA